MKGGGWGETQREEVWERETEEDGQNREQDGGRQKHTLEVDFAALATPPSKGLESYFSNPIAEFNLLGRNETISRLILSHVI